MKYLVIICFVLLLVVGFISFGGRSDDSVVVIDETDISFSGESDTPITPRVVDSNTAAILDTEGNTVEWSLLQPHEELASGFYKLTPEQTSELEDYAVYIDSPSSNIMIMLFSEPLGKSRRNAEATLLKQMAISEEQACLLAIEVFTNEFVNQSLSGINFGLSFCPNSFPLD